MAYKVGAKGQITIAKDIRDHLGIEPGWLSLQLVVDGHVEVHFVPPLHRRSLKGSLASYVQGSVPLDDDEEWQAAREKAWASAAREQHG